MKFALALTLATIIPLAAQQKNFSGIYPHLAHTNMEHEVGIGAVVPWAGSLWTNTYGPHLAHGSTDKLRQINTNWNLTIRPESVGGTPANRMIHPESNQLFIGHHIIDSNGKVRTIDPKKTMPGRLTANARHLTDPANKIYYFTMEDGLYEVDVNTLAVKTIIADPPSIYKTHLPGYHGKGAYTGSNRLVVSNNGSQKQTYPSGCLATWNGTDWTIVARNQFVEVTGPGGLTGNTPDDDRVWAMGWDEKSVRLFVLENGKWTKFRFPKGAYTHDAAHGWNTEWPRIRKLAENQYLGHMHGLFFEFPKTFSAKNYGGIKPLGTYTKMPVDYALFNGKLVIGKDDASKFDNAFVQQAQSNLWIGDYKELSNWGPKSGFGGVWLNEKIDANTPSDPFFIGTFQHKTLHLRHTGGYAARIEIQADQNGTGNWKTLQTVTIPANTGYLPVDLKTDAQWIRLNNQDALYGATAYLHLTSDYKQRPTSKLFTPLAEITEKSPPGATLQLPKGLDMKLHAFTSTDNLVEITGDLKTETRATTPAEKKTAEAIAIKPDNRVGVDAASAYIDFKDANGNQTRLRLPKGNPAFDATIGKTRHIREIVTERTHMNLHGTFYELPRPKPGHFINFWQMKPLASHNKYIHDFASWRGMLILSGANNTTAQNNLKLDSTHNLWLGEVDDLWKLGAPTGKGGPWLNTQVKKGNPSDPYLLLGYQNKTLELSHQSKTPVTFNIEIDFLGTGEFSTYKKITVNPNQTHTHNFPKTFAAHWLRITPSKNTTATATLTYK